MPSHDDKPAGSFLSRLKTGVVKTRELPLMNVEAIAGGIGPVDEQVLTELEEALILSDAGADLAREYVVALRAKWRRGELPDIDALRKELRRMIAATLAAVGGVGRSGGARLHPSQGRIGFLRRRVRRSSGSQGEGVARRPYRHGRPASYQGAPGGGNAQGRAGAA